MDRKQLAVYVFVFFLLLYVLPIKSYAQPQEESLVPRVTTCTEPTPEIEEKYNNLESMMDELEAEKEQIESTLEDVKNELAQKLLLLKQLEKDSKDKNIKEDERANLQKQNIALQVEIETQEVNKNLLEEKQKILKNNLENILTDKKNLEIKYCFAPFGELPELALEQKIYLYDILEVRVFPAKLWFVGRGVAVADGGGTYYYPMNKSAAPNKVEVRVKSDATTVFDACKSIVTKGMPEDKALFLVGRGFSRDAGLFELETLSACELMLEKDIPR